MATRDTARPGAIHQTSANAAAFNLITIQTLGSNCCVDNIIKSSQISIYRCCNGWTRHDCTFISIFMAKSWFANTIRQSFRWISNCNVVFIGTQFATIVACPEWSVGTGCDNILIHLSYSLCGKKFTFTLTTKLIFKITFIAKTLIISRHRSTSTKRIVNTAISY